MSKQFFGMPEFMTNLVERGFKIYPHYLTNSRQTNWLACRRIREPLVECETNEGKLQLVISPYSFADHESATADITGEQRGIWFKLAAYSLEPDELLQRLDEVEYSLLNAWNALASTKDTQDIHAPIEEGAQ